MAHLSLNEIPVNVITTEEVDALALAKTLLHEIHAKLSVLLDTGDAGVLDLRALPALGEAGYQFLKEILGVGEVSAEIQSLGCTKIQETAISGIWWVSHYNQEGHILTEVIDISFLPELLQCPKDDVALGQKKLATLLAECDQET